jgi:hypothetical protein
MAIQPVFRGLFCRASNGRLSNMPTTALAWKIKYSPGLSFAISCIRCLALSNPVTASSQRVSRSGVPEKISNVSVSLTEPSRLTGLVGSCGPSGEDAMPPRKEPTLRSSDRRLILSRRYHLGMVGATIDPAAARFRFIPSEQSRRLSQPPLSL